MRWLSLLLILLIAAALLVAHGINVYHAELAEPLAIDEPETFAVKSGQGSRQIIAAMAERGWVRHTRIVEAHARYHGLAARLQAGEYEVRPGTTVAEILDQIAHGRVIRYRLTIPEGWRVSQFLEAALTHPALLPAEGLDADSLLSALGHADGHPEGWLMPDTYVFNRGTPALHVLRTAHEAMRRVLEQEWENRVDGHPAKSPYELLILASIVEKETGDPDERELVAGVFVNRLRQGMRLQTDPTLLYALDPGTTRLSRAELRRDHPYNTYTRDGLPPTPIALPGRASIRASARPAETDALFFVSRNDGTHEFSRTYAEHRAAVIRHQLGGDASRYGRGR